MTDLRAATRETLKPTEHRIKRAVFGLLRGILKPGRTATEPIDGRKIGKVIFLRPDLIGDMACSLPVFDTLRREHPHIKQSIMCSRSNLALIKDDPRFDSVFVYEKRFWRDLITLRRIRKDRYDVVFDMLADDSATGLFLSQWCSSSGWRVGVGKKLYARYYDRHYPVVPDDSRHMIDIHMSLLAAIGVSASNNHEPGAPYLPEASHAVAERFYGALATEASAAVTIGLNLSAGRPSRLWPAEKQVQFLRRIFDEFPTAIVILISSPRDRRRAEELLARVEWRLYQIPPDLSILDVTALMSRLDLMITPDTSIVHLARSLKVPVVALYPRYARTKQWRPFGQEFGVVVSPKEDNVFDIAPEDVMREVRIALSRTGIAAR